MFPGQLKSVQGWIRINPNLPLSKKITLAEIFLRTRSRLFPESEKPRSQLKGEEMRFISAMSKSTVFHILTFMFVLCDAFCRWFDRTYPVIEDK